MAFFSPQLFMMFILLVGQTGGDLLDLVSTDAYWRSKNVTVTVEQLRRDAGPDAPLAAPIPNIDPLLKDLASTDPAVRTTARQKLLELDPAIVDQLKPLTSSPDPELATTAKQIIRQLSSHAQARSIRRLMAIRTLGERKEKDSVEFLVSLTGAKEPFVADYARRALDQIAGTPHSPRSDDKARAADLQALPKDVTLVAQFRTVAPARTISLESLVDDVLKAAKDQASEPTPYPFPRPALPERQQLIDQLTAQLLNVLEAAGNVRVDALSAAGTIDPDNNNVFTAVIFRGQYNPQALLAFMRANAEDITGLRTKFHKVGDTDCIDIGREATIALPSPQCIVIAGGSRSPRYPDAVSDILTRLTPIRDNAPKIAEGGLSQNDQLTPLLKALDPKADLWVCGLVPAPARGEKPFSSFETFTAQAFRDKDSVRFIVTGNGPDAAQVKLAVDFTNENLTRTLASIQSEAIRRKSLTPVVTMFESLKCVADEKSASLTGVFTADLLTTFLVESRRMFYIPSTAPGTRPAFAPSTPIIVR